CHYWQLLHFVIYSMLQLYSVLSSSILKQLVICWENKAMFCNSLHTDLDKGESAVKYTFSGDGAGTIFTIDQITGDIHALRSLDREEKPYYTLRAQAVDVETNRPLEPESEFVIKVQDINDNEPKFLEGPYTASVPEMSPVGKKPIKFP
uniref:Cadherin domain-containing protein n=1 Tax=Cyprinus carpio TaxID=7962 RepID=A0A8C1MDE3_CYPCA